MRHSCSQIRLQQLELLEAAFVACQAHGKSQKYRVGLRVTTSGKHTGISRLIMTIQYVLRSRIFNGFLDESACTGSERQQLSIQIRRNVIAVLVSFVTWSCKSESDRVISCSGNEHENRTVMFCRDSKRVCNCIRPNHVSTTGKKMSL